MLNVVHNFIDKDEIIQYYDNRGLEISSNEFGVHDFNLRTADGLRTQQHYTIHFVLRGEGTFILNNKTYHLAENDVFFTPPNVLCQTTPEKTNPWKYFWIGLNGTGFREILSQLFSMESPVIKPTNVTEIRKLITDLISFCPATKQALRYKALSTAFAIIGILQKEHDLSLAKEPQTNQSEILLQRAIEIIEENYNNPSFKITDICNSLAISHSYLCKIFNKYSNVSANGYLIEIRLREARVLLERDDTPIQTIAMKVGYVDIAHFSREFKRIFGFSPKDYRAICSTKIKN